MGGLNHNRFFIRYLEPQIKTYSLDKNSGFVKEDNSGRSNIFSTGEKALYSYSPSVEKVARSGIGGSQGLIIVVITIVLVGLATFNLGNKGISYLINALLSCQFVLNDLFKCFLQ